MKIAVTSAFGWPYVRRGNRVAYELAVYLASRGNEVHFITTKPGEVRRDRAKGNLLIKYYPVIDNPILTHFKVEYWQTFALTCLNALQKEDYDIVHTSLTMDAFAASLNWSFKGTPFVPILIQGDPLFKDARRAKRLFQRVVRTASRLVTISNFVNEILKRDFGVDGVIIPCPVDTSKFYYAKKENSDAPRILCTAAITIERKRVPLLVKAFEILIEHIPNAILQLAGETTPEVTRNLLMTVNAKARESIQVVDITSDAVLSWFYRNATITVLPSLKEPFGMVTTESLASGTPVVGTRSGGTAEILDDPRVGVLFEPTDGPEELCKALIKGLELAQDPETPTRCHKYAQRYSWNTLGLKYEALHSDILNTNSRKYSRLIKIVEKGRSPVTSNEEEIQKGFVDRTVLNRFFVDTLDEMEITAQTYYEIESCKPRCVYVLEWLLKREIRDGNVMVLSSLPHFLAILLKNLAFQVRHVVINSGADVCAENSDCEILHAPQFLADIQERFGVIVCDDLLQHLVTPDSIFQILKKHLTPDGVFILATPNVNRCANRLNLLSSDKANPYFRVDLSLKDSPGVNIRQPLWKREYSLAEVEEVAVKAGFKVLQKSYITGEKQIDKTNAFAHVPLKTYLVQKLYRLFERAVIPLRSHLFMALKIDRREKGSISNSES